MNINNKTVNTSVSNINLLEIAKKTLDKDNKNSVQNYNEIDYTDYNNMTEYFDSQSKYGTIDYKNINKDKFMPQGFTSNDKYYFIGAYDKDDKKNSRIYIYDKLTGEYIFYIETNNKSHMGGTSFDKKNNILYVTNDDNDITALNWEIIETYINENQNFMQYGNNNISFSKMEKWIEESNNCKPLLIDTTGINLGNDLNSSYTYCDDKFLYIGHFNAASDFNDERKVKQFELDYDKANNKLNIKNVTEFSIPILTQGMATYSNGDTDYIVFSNSIWGSSTLDIYERRKNELVPINTYDVTNDYPSGGIEGIFIDENGILHTISEFKSHTLIGSMKSLSIPMDTLINNKDHKPNILRKAIKIIASEVITNNELINKESFLCKTILNVNDALYVAADNPNHTPLEHTIANGAGYITNSVAFPIISMIFANEVANNITEEDKSAFEVVDDFYSCFGIDTDNIIVDTIGNVAACVADKSEDFGSIAHEVVHTDNALISKESFFTNTGYNIINTSLNVNDALYVAADNPNHTPLEDTIANGAGYMANSVTFPIISMIFANEVANNIMEEDKSAFEVVDDFYSCLGTDTGNIIVDTIGDGVAWVADKSEDFGSWFHDILP